MDTQTRFAAIYTPQDSENYNTLELELEIKLIPTITEEEEPTIETLPQENTEPSETLPEQPVEEEILPTPVKKAESSIRSVVLVFTGVTALIAIAVILVLVLRKRR